MLLTFGAVGAVVKISPLFNLSFLGKAVPELIAESTPLVSLNQGAEIAKTGAPTVLQLLVGAYGGTIGETCAIALLIGFAYLVIRKVIKWYVPTAYVLTVFVLSLILLFLIDIHFQHHIFLNRFVYFSLYYYSSHHHTFLVLFALLFLPFRVFGYLSYFSKLYDVVL